MKFPQKVKLELPNDPAIPLLHVYLKELNQDFEEIPVLSCSLQHVDNLNVHHWMNG